MEETYVSLSMSYYYLHIVKPISWRCNAIYVLQEEQVRHSFVSRKGKEGQKTSLSKDSGTEGFIPIFLSRSISSFNRSSCSAEMSGFSCIRSKGVVVFVNNTVAQHAHKVKEGFYIMILLQIFSN